MRRIQYGIQVPGTSRPDSSVDVISEGMMAIKDYLVLRTLQIAWNAVAPVKVSSPYLILSIFWKNKMQASKQFNCLRKMRSGPDTLS